MDRERIETLSNEDLADLLPIVRLANPELYREIKVELGMRAQRIIYEGYGGA